MNGNSNLSDNSPRVFVCHAGEDNGFTHELAAKLRGNGIDAFVDEWEILPGDKLIDRIFEKGIAEADAFIIILSASSVTKPWVKEELDAALIRRIEEDTKIIPVRVDNCQVPTPLKSTVWIDVDPSSEYSSEFERILSSVYDSRKPPPIGERPERFSTTRVTQEYSHEEESVIRTILKIQYERNYGLIAADEISEAIPDVPIETLNDAVEILEGQRAIEVMRYIGMGKNRFGHVRLTSLGWHKFAKAFLGIDPEGDCDVILALLVSQSARGREMLTGDTIHENLGLEIVRINYAVDMLDMMGFAYVHRGLGTAPYTFLMIESTAESRRKARGILTAPHHQGLGT